MNDESLIRASLTEWQQAFCRKDVDALIALYAPGAVLFDVKSILPLGAADGRL